MFAPPPRTHSVGVAAAKGGFDRTSLRIGLHRDTGTQRTWRRDTENTEIATKNSGTEHRKFTGIKRYNINKYREQRDTVTQNTGNTGINNTYIQRTQGT